MPWGGVTWHEAEYRDVVQMSDVVLVNPGEPERVFQGLARAGLTAIEPPPWCRLIASHLRKHRISVAIVDAEAMQLTPWDAAKTAGYLNPRLVAVVVHGSQPSASTQKMPAASATVQSLKANQPHVPVILVGGHPAALSVMSLKESGADYVCTGEGPIAIRDLLGRGGYLALGIVDRYAQWNPPAPNITDLANEMPGGCWDMLPMGLYRSYAHHAWSNDFQRTPYASIYTSLGCPFSCSFCMIQSPFREGDKLMLKGKANSYRTWPASSVIAEIEELVERYNVTNIRINDEMFVLQPKHLDSICDTIKERYGDRLNLWCYGRCDQTKERFLEKMRSAGFKWLCLGIESVSDQVRDGVAKGEYGRDEIIDTVKRIKDHGINIIANYLFGLPDDDDDSMIDTLDLALELKTEYVNFYSVVAFPGSKLWDDKIKEGWKPPDNWLAWSFHSYEHVPLGTKHLSPAEVLQFRDYAFNTYYNDPSYRAYVLGKFGERAIKEIDFMLSHELKRKLLEDKAA